MATPNVLWLLGWWGSGVSPLPWRYLRRIKKRSLGGENLSDLALHYHLVEATDENVHT